MTYHPIDKPTEPGWYWLCEGGIRWELVRVTQAGWSYRPTRSPTADLEMWQINDDGFMARSKVTPSHSGHGDFGPMQWYGPAVESPAIQPPQKYEAKMDPEAPRRFKWNRHGQTGYGLMIGGGMYFIDCPNRSNSCMFDRLEHLIHLPGEIEWLD